MLAVLENQVVVIRCFLEVNQLYHVRVIQLKKDIDFLLYDGHVFTSYSLLRNHLYCHVFIRI